MGQNWARWTVAMAPQRDSLQVRCAAHGDPNQLKRSLFVTPQGEPRCDFKTAQGGAKSCRLTVRGLPASRGLVFATRCTKQKDLALRGPLPMSNPEFQVHPPLSATIHHWHHWACRPRCLLASLGHAAQVSV
jgi:hypothetical protein